MDDKKIIISNKRRKQYIAYLEETLQPKIFELLDMIGKNQELDEKIQYKVISFLFEKRLFNLQGSRYLPRMVLFCKKR